MCSSSSCRFRKYHGALDGFGVLSGLAWPSSGACRMIETTTMLSSSRIGRQELDRHQVRPDVDQAFGLLGGARRGLALGDGGDLLAARGGGRGDLGRHAGAGRALGDGGRRRLAAAAAAGAGARRPRRAGAAGAGRRGAAAPADWAAGRCPPRRRAACTAPRARRATGPPCRGFVSSAIRVVRRCRRPCGSARSGPPSARR